MTSVFTDITLDRCKFYLEQHVSQYPCLLGADVTALASAMSKDIIFRVAWSVAGKQEVIIDETVPVTWADAFKERWFPKWLLSRYPVRYRRLVVNKSTTFPSISLPGYGDPVVVMTKTDYQFQEGVK